MKFHKKKKKKDAHETENLTRKKIIATCIFKDEIIIEFRNVSRNNKSDYQQHL